MTVTCPRPLAAVWLGQLALAAVLIPLHPVPVRPLLIERTSCTAEQSAELVGRYRPLYWQHQLGQQRWDPVIRYGVFGEERLGQPPSPQQLADSAAVGVEPEEQRAVLHDRFPDALILRCGGD
jgi:hypothetical protein